MKYCNGKRHHVSGPQMYLLLKRVKLQKENTNTKILQLPLIPFRGMTAFFAECITE